MIPAPSVSLRRFRFGGIRVRAFTLIELLTVIAIIGILAAILIPVVGHVRASALATQNFSRLRSLGQAYQLYAGDNRGVLPIHATDPTRPIGGWGMQTALAPYLDLKETGNLRFMSNIWWDAYAERNGTRNATSGEGDLFWAGEAAYPGGPPRSKLTGWVFSQNVRQPGPDEAAIAERLFTRMNQVSNPARTVLILSRREDNRAAGDASRAWNSWSDGRPFAADNPRSLGAKRFLLYFDGHVDAPVITGENYNAWNAFSR